MKSTPVFEALAHVISTGTELLKSLSSHDYKTRGYIIISEDDPHFGRRVEEFRQALHLAETVLRKYTMKSITVILAFALTSCVYDISRADSRPPERPIINEIVINSDGAARELAKIREELK